MVHSAERTRSRRQRAGSRRNKRFRTVGTFFSDRPWRERAWASRSPKYWFSSAPVPFVRGEYIPTDYHYHLHLSLKGTAIW